MEALSPYTVKMLKLSRLQKAGYPLRANDLTLEEWLDLERVHRWQETLAPSISK